MFLINTLLFGLVAGLIGLKIALLAAAAVLFVQAFSQRNRKRSTGPAPASARRPRLDVHA